MTRGQRQIGSYLHDMRSCLLKLLYSILQFHENSMRKYCIYPSKKVADRILIEYKQTLIEESRRRTGSAMGLHNDGMLS